MPAIAWTPDGGKNGTLNASGHRVVSEPEGAETIDHRSGRTLMINRRFGKGPWTMIPAPFVISPTGGYSDEETVCPG